MKALLIAILFSVSSLHADVNQAKAAYMAGAAKEKAKDYQGAIGDYEAALKAFPGYVYANKQLGNCYYRLGRTSEALEQYDIYLAKVPTDSATKNFADSVRAREEPAPSSSRKKKKADKNEGEMGLNSSFYMGFALGSLANDGSDIGKLYGGSLKPSVSTFTLMEDIRLGYQFSSGLAVEGGYENFNRGATVSFPNTYSSVLFIFAETVYFIEPMYRFQLSRKIALDGGLKLGMTSLSAQSTSGYSSSLVVTGSGLMYMPELRLEFLLGRHVGLDLGAGYRIDSVSPLKYPNGTVVTDGAGGNWASNDGGIEYKIGLNIYFSRVRN